ncbi:MAG: GTP-binding protein, partial [Dehalococcoidia bacterium]
LRFTTAGSVDDGKSTLIGRLLYDSKQTFDDQLAAVERVSNARGDEYVNLALLTDGLRSEREQGITIDVAYRYFATPNRKFILADTPGHVQYTRNMVTGASTANLALILVDARHGIVEQTRRHAYLASLLGIPHLVLCVNKMDLVDFDAAVFERITTEFQEFAQGLEVRDVTSIPLSALWGDNVVEQSSSMRWYQGTTLLSHLETVQIAADSNLEEGRFPVQHVLRPVSSTYPDYRGYAGTVAGGIFRPGDAVIVCPSGLKSTIEAIETYDGPIDEAYPPMSVTLRLADDLDIARGDLISDAANPPRASQEIEAMVCWMSERSVLAPRTTLAIKHTTRNARACVEEVRYRLDVNTLSCDEGVDALALNEIGLVRLRTTTPLMVDDYRRNRASGSFILIDEATNNTVGAGMILDSDG